MIAPIGDHPKRVHYCSWVTYSLMILCALVFFMTRFSTYTRLPEGVRLLEAAIEFHREHPYLELDSRLQDMLQLGGSSPDSVASPDQQRLTATRRRPQFIALEQVELDALTRTGFGAVEETPHRWWGVVPGSFSVIGLLTYMFLHASGLSLLANLLLIHFAGSFLEEAWERWFFAVFYIAAGVVSALFFVIRFHGLEVVLVGASGATAGLMGACLVRHWDRGFRFSYWLGSARRGTVCSPAWVILPIWILREIVCLAAKDVVAPGVVGGEIALWAHVPGFVAGAGATAALQYFGWESRFLNTFAGTRSRVVDSAGLERALANRRHAPADDEVWLSLAKEARGASGDSEAASALWNLAVETGRTEQAVPVLLKVIHDQVQRGEAIEAYVHWRGLRQHADGARTPLALEIRLAELLAKQRLKEESVDVVRSAAERAGPEMAPGALMRLARSAEGEERIRVAGMVLSHPGLTNELRREIEAFAPVVATAGERPGADSSAGRTGAAGRSPDLTVMQGVPLAIQNGKMALDVPGGGRRALPLARIRAIAAGSLIDENSGRPYHIMDLLLHSSMEASSDLQGIRFDTRSFDPRKLIPSEQEEEDAFLSLVGAVLAKSGAAWLLGTNPTRLNTYDSLRGYEKALVSEARSGLGLRGAGPEDNVH